MSVFDLFRGFFGVPGGHFPGRRDPFFDSMTRDEDDDDEDDAFYYDGFRGDGQDPFDSAWKFGFSFSPDGMRIQEPPLFGQVLREMEEIFSQLGRWDSHSGNDDILGIAIGKYFELSLFIVGIPSIAPPPGQEGSRGSSGNSLRDFMLKHPDSDNQRRTDIHPSYESPHFPGVTPFSKFNDVWRERLQKIPADERKEDKDLDSAVSSGGLDQILRPPADQLPSQQPRSRSFFQSVTVTKVLKPDGTMEERRTVRDGQGNEETTVTRSGGRSGQEGPGHHTGPALPGSSFSDMPDEDSDFFSKLFGGFK
ncbi:HCLS1-associated protein X-1 isoform X1 [Syngnathus scovelli]|uniref:HCLS1-associated protein X-1 isoform X1 n=1 Tax=Syngnathus scovelli TaxID=161590 RepID=UPI002110329D|nr:HCLS1-associated protein X-1 isoform X1 [Syngnathus scovelli]